MKLEDRYLVFKRLDIKKALDRETLIDLSKINTKVIAWRRLHNKKLAILKGIFIEKDWPEYMPTLNLLAKRVDGEETETETIIDKTKLHEGVGTQEHYNFKIQPIEYIIANELDFCQGNVVKYVTRFKRKNGLEDLKKARQYLDWLIEQEEKENGTH